MNARNTVECATVVIVKTPPVASSVNAPLDSWIVVMGLVAWVSIQSQNTLQKLLKNMECLSYQGILTYELNKRMPIQT